ncbi:Subunit of the glycosylphosphatidylinositol transamidase complex-like protein [Entophlyctis luteolus]|nr:Subunit of the glycosylphosphatidylinositol transamidase complex-like protein [Entophlyctis luteolus]
MLLRCLFVASIATSSLATSQASGPYAESLVLTQTLDGRVAAEFAFELPSAPDSHPLASVVRATGVSVLDLSFSYGSACARSAAIRDCRPPGVVLWAWMDNAEEALNATSTQNPESLRASRWTRLTNALAGTFCASLNFITPEVSAEPADTFAVEGIDPDEHWLRFATLPREITCTENLTPWVKLLPCTTKAGIATLFNPYSLYDADYHSMRVSIRRSCSTDVLSGERNCTVSVVHKLVVLLDPVRKGHLRNIDWSLRFLFDRDISGLCPVAREGSNVIVRLPASREARFSGASQPAPVTRNHSVIGSHEWNEWKFPLEIGKNLQFAVSYKESQPNRNDLLRSSQPIHIHRHVTGYGRERGGITIRLMNNDPSTKNITLLQSIPWYLRIYLHTLQITSQNSENATAFVMHQQRYQASVPRLRPSVLEITGSLAGKSTAILCMDFDRAFIKYTEHPPDANRGFDIGSAVVTVWPEAPENFSKTTTTPGELIGQLVFSEVVLIALPTPDFSMPYNVITMTCTVVALYFGNVFNLIVKQLQGLPEDKPDAKRWWMFWKRAPKEKAD